MLPTQTSISGLWHATSSKEPFAGGRGQGFKVEQGEEINGFKLPVQGWRPPILAPIVR